MIKRNKQSAEQTPEMVEQTYTIGNGSFIASKIVFIILGVLMAVFSVSLVIPIIWTIVSSFKDTFDYTLNPFSLPDIWMFENYSYAWQALSVEVWNASTKTLVNYTYGKMFLYSLFITVVSSFMNVFLPTLTAYIVNKYKFPGRDFLYKMAVFIMIVPIVGSLSSSLAIRRSLGIYDNLIPFLLTSGSGFGFNFILPFFPFTQASSREINLTPL